MFEHFFQTLPLPADQLTGSYNISLVILSYLIGTTASYVALDITGRMKDVSISSFTSYLWLIGGSLAMGAGIWSMHFIGMLAFVMKMPMEYNPFITGLSMVVAVVASSIAFLLLRARSIRLSSLLLGGIIMGIAIAAMHYIGMAAMQEHMQIHYIPSLFILSVIIAIVASEAALYLAIKSANPNIKHRFTLKAISALVMGAAICGMHYTGMAAAVFTPIMGAHIHLANGTNPDFLSVIIAMVAIFILAIAIAVSSFNEALSTRAITTARQAGMAEVASSVLHNVGNVLNSVNVSSTLIKNHLANINIEKLVQVNQLLDDQKQDLAAFISSDRGSRLPGYLVSLTENWQEEKHHLSEELNRLDENIKHINGIISVQQSMNGIMNFAELVSIEKLIDEALLLTSIDFFRQKIKVKKEYTPIQPVIIDKLKLSQIIINLIQNAKDSVQESANQDKKINIKINAVDKSKFFIEVSDNGMGINPQNDTKMFSYGFTTKKSGHGLGLHSSIILANEMNGTLSVTSEGIGKGATFRLEMPYQDFRSKKHN